MNINLENYKSINAFNASGERNWCLSAKLGSGSTVSAKLEDGKTYKYISKYPVSVGDLAVIGNVYSNPQDDGICVNSTGRFAVVTEAEAGISVKKSRTALVDFVFTPEADKKAVKDCGKLLTENNYNKILQFGSFQTMSVKPFGGFVRKFLAAASVLANPKLADAVSLSAAKECVKTAPRLEGEILKLQVCIEDMSYDFSQTYVDFTDFESELASLTEDSLSISDAHLSGLGTSVSDYDEILRSDVFQAFITKYSYCGAISVMIRGRLNNLLAAFLAENPPIEKYMDIVNKLVAEYGDDKIKALF